MDSSSSSSCCCYLQVDVNGEETFFVDKRVVCSFSSKLSRLFGISSCDDAQNLKLIFNDFPGGAVSFELVSRFCYNDGKVEISPSNVAFLHAAARYMEMRDAVSGVDNLVGQTRKALEEVKYWTWSDLIASLKQCQELNMVATLSGASFLEKCLDSVVGRVALSSEPSPSPSTSSSDSSGLQFSCDTKSTTTTTTTESLQSSFSRATWWFDDLLFANPALLERLVRSMILQKFDHGLISKFLFYYYKSKSQLVTSHEKCEIMEVLIDLLDDLERGSVSCKSLFGLLRTRLILDIDGCSRNKLEIMIGSQMDQATLDNLLIPSPSGMNHLYDVDLILRLLNGFLKAQSNRGSTAQLQKVTSLLDAYLAEVAPDPYLKTSKFLALAVSLPDSARVSHDNIYHAMDMYMEVHAGLSEEDKAKIYCALNYSKLSAEAYKDISHNPKFTSKHVVQARISLQSKFRTLLPSSCSPCRMTRVNSNGKNSKLESQKQNMQYAGGLDLPSDNEKLQAQLRGMQSRVTELEKVCRKMQNQMSKMLKSRVASHNRSLPRLCS